MTRPPMHISDERGTAMVEMALVLPILLFLSLAIVDFGKAINYWNDTNQIAADAARFAAVNKNPGAGTAKCGLTRDQPCDDFRDWIRSQAETGELEASDAGVAGGDASTTGALQVCVEFPNGTKAVGSPVRVTVKTGYNLIPLLNKKPVWNKDEKRDVFGTIRIKGEATMRLEQTYSMQEGCSP